MTKKIQDEKVVKFKELLNELAMTYEAKNHDYGDSFEESINKWGLIAAVVRMSDKVNRLGTLANQAGIGMVNEKLSDTAKDLANYAAMTAIWLNEHKI